MDFAGGVDESAALAKRTQRHRRKAKDVKRQRLGPSTAQEDLKRLQQLWELRDHAVVNHALRCLYPRMHGGRLQCSNCIQPLMFAHVQAHTCTSSPIKVKLTEDLVRGGRCTLCQRFAAAGRDHSCKSLNSFCIDLTAMSAFQDGGAMAGKWESDPLAVTRYLRGPWVILFPGGGDSVMRHHAFVWDSQVPGAGSGMYTLSGLSGLSEEAVNAFDLPRTVSETDWSPTESTLAVGYYTGVAVEGGEAAESERLSALTLEDGSMVDPELFGGVLVRANQAHGSSANICVMGSALMVAARVAKAGRELLWDYRSYTNDPNDPLLNITCSCQGRACRYAHLRISGRTCPGKLIVLQI
jgi:hypothetical protein